MIIVTGGAGFIGSNIVAELQDKGYKDIVVVDWLGNDDKWKNIAKRELAAVISPDNLLSYIEEHKIEITAIIHMGAISTTTETDVDLIINSNFNLSWNLWEFCCDNNIQYIYASSAATYGDGTLGFTPRTKRVIETAFVEARKLGYNYIGTEHLLIGILNLDTAMDARKNLLDRGVSPKKILW